MTQFTNTWVKTRWFKFSYQYQWCLNKIHCWTIFYIFYITQKLSHQRGIHNNQKWPKNHWTSNKAQQKDITHKHTHTHTNTCAHMNTHTDTHMQVGEQMKEKSYKTQGQSDNTTSVKHGEDSVGWCADKQQMKRIKKESKQHYNMVSDHFTKENKVHYMHRQMFQGKLCLYVKILIIILFFIFSWYSGENIPCL